MPIPTTNTPTDAQIQFQQQLNLKVQEANITLAQQQQTYSYREAMAKEIAVPASFVGSISLVAVVAFTLISRQIRSQERMQLDRNQADIAIAKYDSLSDDDDDEDNAA